MLWAVFQQTMRRIARAIPLFASPAGAPRLPEPVSDCGAPIAEGSLSEPQWDESCKTDLAKPLDMWRISPPCSFFRFVFKGFRGADRRFSEITRMMFTRLIP
ncbi:hypothetical protein ACQP0C_39580 [Nocardia sp. CA-129566]|uniref:hypothetical protein n=1 Tax=Nocardia sp. CA-129566 TaxID=3239976 RepID=UPI003D989575